MPNMMATLPNIRGALFSTPQSLATRVQCSNAAKTWNPLKSAGVPQTCQRISAVSRPKFTILSGHAEEVLLFNKFFFRLSTNALVPKCLSSEDIADDIVRWCQNGDFFASCISSEPHAAHFRLHSKFALGPHHVCMVDIQSAVAEIRRGKKRKKKERRR